MTIKVVRLPISLHHSFCQGLGICFVFPDPCQWPHKNLQTNLNQLESKFQVDDKMPIEFYFPVTIAIIPDMLVTNLITKLSKSCLVVMACQTILAGMKVFINGTQNSHD